MLKSTSLSRRSQNRIGFRRNKQVDFDFDFDFNILTALKGWVGLAP
jgi:hypothetical protein